MPGKTFAMKRVRWHLLPILVSIILAPAGFGAEVISESFVTTEVTIVGADTKAFQDTWLSSPMVSPFVAAGMVTSLGSNTLYDAEGEWSADQFNGVNGPYYVEFNSGYMADIVKTDPATRTLSVSGDLRPYVTGGEAYRIRKHFTIGDIFGAQNEAGLTGGLNDAQADTILLQAPGRATTIFYLAHPKLHGWVKIPDGSSPAIPNNVFAPYEPAAGVIIYPEQGIMIRRKAAQSSSFHMRGQVKTTPTKVPVYPGWNVLGTLKSFRNVKLADLKLYTGDAASGLNGGKNDAVGDNLMLIQPDGSTVTYWYCPVAYGDGMGWRKVAPGVPIANDDVIAPGTVFLLCRKAPWGVFTWEIPSE